MQSMCSDENAQFRRRFQEQCDTLDLEISGGRITHREAFNKIDAIQKEVQQRLDQLTSFDQNKCREKLQKLRETAQKLKTSHKFQFKSKLSRAKSDIPVASADCPTGRVSIGLPADRPRTCQSSEIREKQANVTIADLQSSDIYYDCVEGAVYIDNVVDSHIRLRHAQQCRIHNSKKVKISLGECRSAILEDSVDILFLNKYSDVNIFDFSSPDTRNYQIGIDPNLFS